MAMIMDDHDKHEELSEIQFLKGQRSQSINPMDLAAMQGINHLKQIGEEEDKDIDKTIQHVMEVDDQIDLDFSKFNDEKMNEED